MQNNGSTTFDVGEENSLTSFGSTTFDVGEENSLTSFLVLQHLTLVRKTH